AQTANAPQAATPTPLPGQVATTTPPAAAVPGANPAAAVPLPQGQVFGEANKNARVVLRVRAATRILVEGPDGKVYINRALQPGDTYNVPLVPELTLTTPDGSAVELDLDGQAMGLASKGGVTEALPLDPQSVADHANQG
ncbi:MAG TPA: RodZ domain-containing protein, partial [Rhizomicrobium sp.]